jgi:pimeloyl-ACP methyl ester carboxylesterase
MLTVIALVLVLLVAASCGSAGDAVPRYDVATSVVSHEATQDITVWAPEAEGSWPVVYAVHGFGADRSRWDVTGPELASRGLVDFATDYRSKEPQFLEQDIECGWRYAASISDSYGGDLEQPITFVGHSMGATMVFVAGLNEAAYGPGGTYDECLTAAPMPDVIVPISGCLYEFGDVRTDFASRVSTMSNRDVDVVLVAGSVDEACESWQSEDATQDLLAEGYNARFVEINGADHFAVIYNDLVDGEVVTRPDEPAGDEVVQTILDAIDAAGS